MSDLPGATTKKDLLYRINNWRGGLNKSVESYDLRDDELADVSNVVVTDTGSIKPRMGTERFEDILQSGSQEHWASERRKPSTGLYRYGQMNGKRETLLQAGNFVYADADSRVFTEITNTPQGNDGTVRFVQWRDTVFFHRDTAQALTYQRDATPTTIDLSQTTGVTGIPATKIDTLLLSGSNNFDANSDYIYRFTFDYFHGNDFLGESFPLHTQQLTDVPHLIDPQVFQFENYWHIEVSQGGTAQRVQFLKQGGFTTWTISNNVRYVNIYRSEPLTLSDWGPVKSDRTRSNVSNLFYVGRFSTSDHNDAEIGDVLFTDDGFVLDTSRLLSYQVREILPRSKFMTPHKGRMWYANAIEDWIVNGPNGIQESVIESSRLYFSNYLRPIEMKHTSFLPIAEEDGEQITGLVSWRGRVLLVFKPSNITGIIGSATDLGGGVIDIEIQLISEEVGCIAPGTIAVGEGVIFFLSNNGMMFYDGTKPKPLNTHKIKDILDTVPDHRKYFATGVYVNKSRQYWLAISSNEVEADENSVILRYDFETNTWMRNAYGGITSGFGYNTFIESKRGDEEAIVLGGVASEGLVQLTIGAVHILEETSAEINVALGVTWSAETKQFDCGLPEYDKTFHYIFVKAIAARVFTITWDVDNGIETGTFSFAPGGNAWDDAGLDWDDTDFTWDAIRQEERVFKFSSASRPHGKRIGFTFSGQHDVQCEISAIAIGYSAEKRLN